MIKVATAESAADTGAAGGGGGDAVAAGERASRNQTPLTQSHVEVTTPPMQQVQLQLISNKLLHQTPY